MSSKSRFRKIAVAFAAASLLSLAGASVASADTISTKDEFGDVFFHNDYVSLGIGYNAHFGSCTSQQGCVAIPDGYPSREGLGRLGFLAVNDLANPGTWSDQSTLVGDFFTPGGPYEGWYLTGNGNSWQNSNGDDAITGEWDPVNSGDKKFTWNSTNTSQTAGLQVKQVTRVIDKSTLLDNTITITNTSSDPVTDVYYGRSVDPDNCQSDPTGGGAQSGSFDTVNHIYSQVGVNGATRSMVGAKADCGGTHQSILGLASRDEGAVVCNDCWGIDPVGLASRAADYPADAELTNDTGIGLTIPAVPGGTSTLAPGQSVTLHFAYFLNLADAEKAGFAIPEDLLTPATTDGAGGPGSSSGLVNFTVTGVDGHTYQVSTTASFKKFKVFANGAKSSIRVAIPGYKKGKVGTTTLYVRDTADPEKKTVLSKLNWDFSIPWIVWGSVRTSYYSDGKTPNPGYWDVSVAARDTAAPEDTRGLWAEVSYSKTRPSDKTPFPTKLAANKVFKVNAFASTVKGAAPPHWIRVQDSWSNKSAWHGLGNMPTYPDTGKK